MKSLLRGDMLIAKKRSDPKLRRSDICIRAKIFHPYRARCRCMCFFYYYFTATRQCEKACH